MGKATTSERLKYLMKERDLTQVDILKLVEPFAKKLNINFNKSILSMYINGRMSPGSNRLTLLGMALNVSEVWLMGHDVPMERETPVTIVNQDQRTAEFIILFEKLTPDQQFLIIKQIRGILSE